MCVAKWFLKTGKAQTMGTLPTEQRAAWIALAVISLTDTWCLASGESEVTPVQ